MAAAGMAAVAITGCASHGRSLLVVEDVGRERVVHQGRVAPGESVVLSYVHSSEHVPVRGTFVVETDGTLRAKETAFAGFGPGLPSPKTGEAWRLEDGMIVVPAVGERLSELRFSVTPLTRHRLWLPSGEDVDLSALLGPGGRARIYVSRQRR